MGEKENLRIDKYLWAIRAFKTRSLATDACRAGRIKLEGTTVKPSHIVKLAEIYSVQKGPDRRIIKVSGLSERRTDAKTAVTFYEDLTPPEETKAFKSMFQSPVLIRDRGAGRPTKRDRREIDGLLLGDKEEESWFEGD